jgi:hypothetical protein
MQGIKAFIVKVATILAKVVDKMAKIEDKHESGSEF